MHIGTALIGQYYEGSSCQGQQCWCQSDLTYYADNRRYALCRLAEALTSLIGSQIMSVSIASDVPRSRENRQLVAYIEQYVVGGGFVVWFAYFIKASQMLLNTTTNYQARIITGKILQAHLPASECFSNAILHISLPRKRQNCKPRSKWPWQSKDKNHPL